MLLASRGWVRKGVGGVRWVSTRCFDFVTTDFLLGPVGSSSLDDEAYYPSLALNSPLRDPVTGCRIHVLGTATHSQRGAEDVRAVVRRLHEHPKPLEVLLDVPSEPMLQSMQQLLAAHSRREQETALNGLVNAGSPPDTTAELLVNLEAFRLEPYCDMLTAAAECRRLGVPMHFIGRPPMQEFLRVQAVRNSVTRLLATPDDVTNGLFPNELGMFADREYHKVSEAMAEDLALPPTPRRTARLLETLDLPSLLFRLVHPVVHMVRQIRSLTWDGDRNDTALLLIVPAYRAHLVRHVWEAELSDDEMAGVQYSFNLSELTKASAEQGGVDDDEKQADGVNLLPLEELESSLSEDAERRQAEFEIELVLFHHLSKIRPDILQFKSAVANVLIMHDCLAEAVEYLTGMVRLRTHPEAADLLRNIVTDLVDKGALTPSDGVVSDAEEAYNEWCKWVVQEAPPGTDTAPPLLLPPSERKVEKMIQHSKAAGRVLTVRETIPNIANLEDAEGSSKSSAEDALALVKERSLQRHEPKEEELQSMTRRRKDMERHTFTSTQLNPLSDTYAEMDGSDLPNHGIIHALPRYHPSPDFPLPPDQKLAVEEHAKAMDAYKSRRFGESSPMKRLVGEAQRVNTSGVSRTQFDSSLVREDRTTKQRTRMWARYDKEAARRRRAAATGEWIP